MVCKILFFDYKDSDKSFFDKKPLDNFCITFLKDSLNEQNINSLPLEGFEQTAAISINQNSEINKNVLEKFKNLRVISTRSKNYDHIDLQACIQRNIAVVNVENYKPESQYYNLNASFRAITGVLCGEKSCRII